jgi:hypothetical protein
VIYSSNLSGTILVSQFVRTRKNVRCIVACFESHFSEVALLGQPIWRFLGNRLVETHIRGNVQATETELVEIVVSFAVLP